MSDPGQRQSTAAAAGASNGAAQSAPAITLPKGGGAIKGIGEKFAANPVTGTGSMSVPIATSPGRSGFGPQLTLSYDSGAGNGPFGFGWSLSIPSITRKTDKGLPQYFDAEESDVFVLSGAEDLVPVFKKNPNGTWALDQAGSPIIGDYQRDGFTVRPYRPRIEGLFARIERWTRDADGDVHWRSISPDNILTLYGKDENARIADPQDPHRIFSWLICESRDDKGNVVIYEYKAEDGVGVALGQAHERNRGDQNDPRRTANRYLKHIRYGNRAPLLDHAGQRPPFLPDAQLQSAEWMFEAVFDYGEHDADAPTPNDAGSWTYRNDPFSSYRAGFEVRTTRLCQRVLMFHHISDQATGIQGYDGLVRSTDFTYSFEQDPSDVRNPIYSFLLSVTHSGYQRSNGGYLKRSMPPVEYEYTQPIVDHTIYDVDAASLENLPIGVDGVAYQWTDLHGEGIPGLLTEQAGAWFYKRNISPISERPVEFAPLERVALKPNLAFAGGQAQFMDLAGDGQPDLVVLDGPIPGLYEHDEAEGWQPFRPFTARLNRDTRDPNMRFVDLDGDGHADVLISEDDALVWHPSLAEQGFGPARRVRQPLDEEKGPRLVFDDGTQSIYLADMCGDGLTDLVRIRNGDVSYWPNLGYGRFGARIAMDRAPHFDGPDQFEHRRIRLADIDGTGTTDIIYLHRDGVRLYFNQSGNSWSAPEALRVFPRVDDLVSIAPADLLGNGTACLVWSSALPGDARQQMRYVDLMGGQQLIGGQKLIGKQKPHLLVRSSNNLGAETLVTYAPSTKFYLQDKRDGNPWITRLPFAVHVVERVETYDYISRNRFVTRYAYHHGYFDGEEREFRGFGMVEQFDTETFASLNAGGDPATSDNVAAASHVPPVHTKTWFHTGAYIGRDHVSDFFAGLLDAKDVGEYYREPGLTDEQARQLLLADTVLPEGLSIDEEREACRALKGAMLRQEVYADDAGPDATADQINRASTPYSVAEQNFTIVRLQPQAGNHHAVFFTHANEAISYHYERTLFPVLNGQIVDESTAAANPTTQRLPDPRVTHTLTLEVDAYGNVLKTAAIGYRRLYADLRLPTPPDRDKQNQTLITYTESRVTNAIEAADDYHTPLPCEARTYELTGYTPTGAAGRFQGGDFVQVAGAALTHLFDSKINYEDSLSNGRQRRLIEHVRSLYRPNDMGGAQNDPLALLPLGTVDSLALPGESYKLAFTPGLLDQVYVRGSQQLLPADPADVLKGGADQGGYVDLEGDRHWWIPSGRVFFSPGSADTAAQELAYARLHFFLPHRSRNPFHTDAVSTESFVSYDIFDLLMVEARDALGNVVTVNTIDDAGVAAIRIDCRVLQPFWVTDPNGNRAQVVFDTLGMVVGTAVMGKPRPAPIEGDSLALFEADLSQAQIDGFYDAADPHVPAPDLLRDASTRIIYDLDRFQRTRMANPTDPTQWLPVYAASLARETHASDPLPPQGLKIQISFSYSDGFGREIQKKIQAEPGPLVDGGPDVDPRWVSSGWTIFNNKGKPVRQYEPFFSKRQRSDGSFFSDHRFEFGVQVGVSPILFYDPVERVVATLHPNHTWEKVVFDPWQQATWDVNDTVLNADSSTDPKSDQDVRGFFARLPDADYLPTWYEQRSALAASDPERVAADKAAIHRQTPTVAHLDTLGRPFLTIAQNRFERDGALVEEQYATRVELDIEGNQRAVIDANDRVVMRYAYDMLGNRIHQASMEAGERWMLNDVAGQPIRAWDSRDHQFRSTYDQLRRPTESFLLTGAGPELLIGRTFYGETQPNPEARNLRGKAVQNFDQAGIVTSDDYDFKGNPLSGQRQLAREYKTTLDWKTNPPLEVALYASSTRYDALNRPTELTTPHTATMQPSIIRPSYNEANLLEGIKANLRSAATPTVFVGNIDYNAKGQRTRIEYGNSVSTTYEYEELTFRLSHMQTMRGNQALQDLRYIYDPAGNITRISDDAQDRIFHSNQAVLPSSEYLYDAVYRLIGANGREHKGDGQQIGWDDRPRMVGTLPNDGQALQNYVETYVYDAVGNIMQMIHHQGRDLAQPGQVRWNRRYQYAPDSNRLLGTSLPGDDDTTFSARYQYDAHGNMTRMPHLPLMQWDYRDQLQVTSQQVVNNGDAREKTYYVYDAAGQRVRKVTELATGSLKNERIYLGGFEIYRQHAGADAGLVRETLHIMDGQQRIALVETKTQQSGLLNRLRRFFTGPEQLIRYQFGNHLGSASLELDDQAQVISYEEYYPYGSTSYQAVRSQTETPKRYRYTGMERDEESGLAYHSARYYAPWLGRWTSYDPVGISVEPNLYPYALNNPIVLLDPNGRDAWWSSALDFVGNGLSWAIGESAANAPGLHSPTIARISTPEAGVRALIFFGSGGLGAIVGKRVAVATTSKILAGAATGATVGGVTSIGAVAEEDAFRGEVSSRQTYLKAAGIGVLTGGAIGAGAGAINRVVKGPSYRRVLGPPANLANSSAAAEESAVVTNGRIRRNIGICGRGDCAAQTAARAIQEITGEEISAADLVREHGLPTKVISGFKDAVAEAKHYFSRVGLELSPKPGGFASVSEGGTEGSYVIFLKGGEEGGHVVYGQVIESVIRVVDDQLGKVWSSLEAVQKDLGLAARSAYRITEIKRSP